MKTRKLLVLILATVAMISCLTVIAFAGTNSDDCLTCGGDGKVGKENNVPCSDCFGTGKVAYLATGTDSVKEINQLYNLTIKEEKTDVTKVQVSWKLENISAGITINKIWDTEDLKWVNDSTKANTATAKSVNAEFDFVNLSSIEISATIHFEEEKGFSPTFEYTDKTGTVDNTQGKVKLGTVVTTSGVDLAVDHSGSIYTKLTPGEKDFSKITTDTTGKYGTYTVLISAEIYSVTVKDTDTTKIYVPKGTTISFDTQTLILNIGSYKELKLSTPNPVENEEAENKWTFQMAKTSEAMETDPYVKTVSADVDIFIFKYDCLAAGTKIAMADGGWKNVEDIAVGDMVLTFNHESGEYESRAVYLAWECNAPKTAFTLNFSNGNKLSVIGDHALFEQEECKYVSIYENNAEEFIGKHFYNVLTESYEKLLSVTYESEPVMYYEIYTEYNANCIAEGMLNAPCDNVMFLNIYRFNEDLTANAEQLDKDIAEYGLYEYAPGEDYSAEFLESLRWKYANLVVGKGLATWDDLYAACDGFFAE